MPLGRIESEIRFDGRFWNPRPEMPTAKRREHIDPDQVLTRA
jgi:hypothetical protein